MKYKVNKRNAKYKDFLTLYLLFKQLLCERPDDLLSRYAHTWLLTL